MNDNDKKALNRITKQAAKVTQSELTYVLMTCIATVLYRKSNVLWQTVVTH